MLGHPGTAMQEELLGKTPLHDARRAIRWKSLASLDTTWGKPLSIDVVIYGPYTKRSIKNVRGVSSR
jgi:hypothetical protein